MRLKRLDGLSPDGLRQQRLRLDDWVLVVVPLRAQQHQHAMSVLDVISLLTRGDQAITLIDYDNTPLRSRPSMDARLMQSRVSMQPVALSAYLLSTLCVLLDAGGMGCRYHTLL